MTPAGWAALLLSVGVALALRIALPLWHPEQFAPTNDRKDPRHNALAFPFLLVPVLFAGLAILLLFLGYPVFRLSEPPPPGPEPDRDSGGNPPRSSRTE
jgi:hypothetical protein